MSTRRDAEFAALGAKGFSGSLRDRELAWLQANGATSPDLGDAWMEFFIAQGMTATVRPDAEAEFLNAVLPPPPTGARWTLLDGWLAYWSGGGTPP